MADKTDFTEIKKLLESKDYKQRFIGEYLFVRDKVGKLDDMIDKYYDGTLGFTPDCPIDVLEMQSYSMWSCIKCLEYRADIELISLPRS